MHPRKLGLTAVEMVPYRMSGRLDQFMIPTGGYLDHIDCREQDTEPRLHFYIMKGAPEKKRVFERVLDSEFSTYPLSADVVVLGKVSVPTLLATYVLLEHVCHELVH